MTDPALRVAIVGAGGFGREVLDVVEAQAGSGTASPPLQFVGFIDDGLQDGTRLEERGAHLLDGFDDLALVGARFLIGIGDPGARRLVEARALDAGLRATSVRHPSSTFGARCQAEEGLVVCSHVSVTTNVVIGRHVHLNLNATVGHDCVLGDFVTINPGANISGDVHLHDGVTIGTGAAVIQGVTIGAGTIVGAGAIVTRDLPEGVVAFGAPARPVRSQR